MIRKRGDRNFDEGNTEKDKEKEGEVGLSVGQGLAVLRFCTYPVRLYILKCGFSFVSQLLYFVLFAFLYFVDILSFFC